MATGSKKNTKKIGDLGEKIAQKYLHDSGFVIVGTNFWRKWGEIDIIAKDKQGVLRFVEVKSVSYETIADLEYAVTHETWQPEEQVHARKLRQIEKTIASWITEQSYDGLWQIDVLAVKMVIPEKYASVSFIENVVQ